MCRCHSGLCSVCKVTKLCFPEYQSSWVLIALAHIGNVSCSSIARTMTAETNLTFDIMSGSKAKAIHKAEQHRKTTKKITRNPLNSGSKPTTVSQHYFTCFNFISVRVSRKQQTPEKQSLWDLKPCPCQFDSHTVRIRVPLQQLHVQGL